MHDRISDQLAGPVIGDVPAPVHVVQLGSHPVQCFLVDQQVRPVAVATHGVGVGVFEEEQVVVAAVQDPAFMDRPLQVPRLPVREPAQPAGTQHHCSSDSQSQVSRFSLMRRRKRTAVDPSKARWSHVNPR